MDIQAIAFDVNGTLVEIKTEEENEQIFRSIGHFLTYQGIDIRRTEVKELYFKYLKRQKEKSQEAFPEFDAVGIFKKIIKRRGTDYTRTLPQAKLDQMPLFLAELFRGISRRRLRTYPHVHDVLNALRERYSLAIISDAQSAYARAELYRVGLLDYFHPIIVSGDFGYRKPDKRLFHAAIESLGVPANKTLYVGNDMYRDIYGAKGAGMKTVMFDSDQGKKKYHDITADFTINDHRKLLKILHIE